MSDTRAVSARSLFATLAVIALLVSGCASQATTQETAPSDSTPAQTSPEEMPIAWPIEINDSELEAIDFLSEPLAGDDRILALAVGSAEIVDLLGGAEQLVGRDETSARPQDVPVVTQAHQIEVERALSLKPTVVLVDELSGPPEAIEALASAGAEVVKVPSVWTLEDVPKRVSVIADAIGANSIVATDLSSALAPSGPAESADPVRVAFVYLRGTSAVYLLGGANTGADALIEAAGGRDVGAELGYDGFVPLTAESIVQADPDVLLVMADGLDSVGGVEGLLALPGIAQTKAGSEGRVVVVDDRTLLSFGSMTPSLVERLGQSFAAAK